MKFACLFLLAVLANDAGCDTVENNAQQQVGMPGVTRFAERRLMRQLYELRDQNVKTYAYVMDFQGRLWHVCDSIGFGLPYGVQFTAPERLLYQYSSGPMIPQPEPNGLFMPPTAEGTWIICASKEGKFLPVYLEPRVIVSTIPMKATGDYQQ